MKKVFIILGFFVVILATILSVTPLYNLAIIPIIIAFVSGILIYVFSKKTKSKTKSIQYIFLLVIISLSITIYKNVFTTNTVENIEDLEKTSDKSEEDAIKLLEDDLEMTN